MEQYADSTRTSVSPSVLAFLKKDGHYKLETDASDRQIGRVILQRQNDNVDRLVCCWSKIIKDHKRKLRTALLECFAAVWAPLIVCLHLEEAIFTVRADKHAVQSTFSFPEVTGELVKWRLRLMEFDFDIVYRADIKPQAFVALSRLSTKRTDDSHTDDGIPIKTFTTRS